MSRVMITGATGFVGRHLVRRFSDVVLLTRDPQRAAQRFQPEPPRCFPWDPLAGTPPAEAFQGVDTVIHLAGESVGQGRWTRAKKQRIYNSRIIGTRNLVAGLRALAQRPALLICASAVGYYGDRGDQVLDETASPGDDFLARTCVDWENESRQAEGLGMRVVQTRFGVILGRDGGALPQMLCPFRWGVGGRLGSGRQWMPWVHIDDVVEAIAFVRENAIIAGPVNVTSPNPVTNRQFTKTLATLLKRPAILPVPRLMLRLVVGEFATVLLASQRVIPRVLEDCRYQFRYPELQPALEDLLKEPEAMQAAQAG